MIAFLRRLFLRLFARKLDKLLVRAASAGAVLLQDFGRSEEHGETTWQCTVRPRFEDRGRRGTMNTWIGSGPTPTEAVIDALYEIDQNPSFIATEVKHAPKLGGREFDE